MAINVSALCFPERCVLYILCFYILVWRGLWETAIEKPFVYVFTFYIFLFISTLVFVVAIAGVFVWESFSFWNIFSLAILIPLIHPDVPFSFSCIRKWIVSIQRQHIPLESEAFSFFHFYFVFYSFLLFECCICRGRHRVAYLANNISHAFV